MHKHKTLFDLISKHYEAFSEETRSLLDDTFGKKSDLKTANYGQIMRWICAEMKGLRKESFWKSVDGALPERYKYDTEPIPLMVIDGKTNLSRSYIPWKAEFSKEMNKFGYDSRNIEVVNPVTMEVVDIEKLRDEAYKKTLRGDYLRVVIAVNKAATKKVYINNKWVGNFWATNTTIGDIKKMGGISDSCELVFNCELYDDCTTLSSLSLGDIINFDTHYINPIIYIGEFYARPDPLEDFEKVINDVEKNRAKSKVVLECGCQPPKKMKVKDVVKLFGNWRDGSLRIYRSEHFVHLLLWQEEYNKMDKCEPLVDTYVDGSVTVGDLFSKYARKLPYVKEVYKRIRDPMWALPQDGRINSRKYSGESLLGEKKSLEKVLKQKFSEIEFELVTPRQEDIDGVVDVVRAANGPEAGKAKTVWRK